MNGGRTVTKDTCLYAEDYAFRLARERTNGTQQTAIVVRSPSMLCCNAPAYGRQTFTRGPMATMHSPSAGPSLRRCAHSAPSACLALQCKGSPGRMRLPPECAPTSLSWPLPFFRKHIPFQPNH